MFRTRPEFLNLNVDLLAGNMWKTGLFTAFTLQFGLLQPVLHQFGFAYRPETLRMVSARPSRSFHQVAVCSWLLEERCAVDAETNGGDTALMLAAWQARRCYERCWNVSKTPAG